MSVKIYYSVSDDGMLQVCHTMGGFFIDILRRRQLFESLRGWSELFLRYIVQYQFNIWRITMWNRIENEMTEVVLHQGQSLADAAIFDDISDEELEARITKDSGTGSSGSC